MSSDLMLRQQLIVVEALAAMVLVCRTWWKAEETLECKHRGACEWTTLLTCLHFWGYDTEERKWNVGRKCFTIFVFYRRHFRPAFPHFRFIAQNTSLTCDWLSLLRDARAWLCCDCPENKWDLVGETKTYQYVCDNSGKFLRGPGGGGGGGEEGEGVGRAR